MADPEPSTDSKSAAGRAAAARPQPPSAPRWVKVFGIVLALVALLVVVLHITGHSPGGHGSHGGTHPL
jgi:hypothetical protein